MKTYIILLHMFLLLQNTSDNIIAFARNHLLLTSNSTFSTDFQYLGAIQIWQKWNEYLHYLTLPKSVTCQIDANCSPFQSLNIFPFHIRLERLKLIYYSLISNLSKYYFKTCTLCFFFLSLRVFTALEFNSNYFGILLGKIVNSRDLNENKPPRGKYSENINQCNIIY